MIEKKVSVIVPVYNTCDTLERCLDSLVGQTLEDIEILIVNDGSPDNSQEIINKYAAKHPDKIRSFEKENGGLSSARNYGIERAEGEYLGFVDSDDYVDIDYFDRMYKKGVELDADVVSSPVTELYEDRAKRKYYNKFRFGVNAKDDAYIVKKSNSFAWNKIYRTSFWKQNNFLFPNQWYEDSAVIYNVLLLANKIACVNIPFYHYIKNRDGSIINSVDERIFDIFKSTDSIISFYKEHDAFEELYDLVELLCVRHIFGRIDLLHRAAPSEINKKFVSDAIAYLDRHFTNWRKNEYFQRQDYDNKVRRYYKFCCRHNWTLKNYASGKRTLYDKLVELQKQKLSTKTKTDQEIAKQNEKKRRAIQRYGLWLIHDVQTLLKGENVVSFADFGTCLGIVREGNLLKHDLDIDIGVIADEERQKYVRVAMERAGYKLWRQYIIGNYIAEESYRLKGVKVDLNYYKVTDKNAKTWLFYRKPELEYNDNTRHIVEMTYSAISGTRDVTIDGVEIAIPENAEKLLEEKYGPKWKTPDTGWIYWESPAAEKLETIGYYITYRYQKIKLRTRETPQPLLIANKEDGSVDWEQAYECTENGYDAIVIGTEEDKEKNRHPRIRVYVGDYKDPEFVEKVRKKLCGSAYRLLKYCEEIEND